MNKFKYLAFAAVAAFIFTVPVPKAQAQVSVGVELGAAFNCPYGYYDYAPYALLTLYGYHCPEMVYRPGGMFIGARHVVACSADSLPGHVNNRFDTQRGYRGARPNVGDKPEASKPLDKVSHFKGNEMARWLRGHVSTGKR